MITECARHEIHELERLAAQGERNVAARRFDSNSAVRPGEIVAPSALFGIKLKGLYTAAARPQQNLLIYESEESAGSVTLKDYVLKLFPELEKARRGKQKRSKANIK